MSDHVIIAEDLVKRYKVYDSPAARLKEVLSLNRRRYHREFTALSDVSLSISRGTTVGVVGQNGAGKSTLLKILAGIIHPTSGRLEVRGKVSSIIELGMGFHPEFTGAENARINAAILGIEPERLDEIFQNIVQFSELGQFINMPVKTYSSGMFARLAFSIAINVEPDILLIDEALSVGDAIFSQRCLQRIRRLQEKGVTIFFVSHDTNTVRGICDEALLMERGTLIQHGSPKEIVQQYEVMVAERLATTGDDDTMEFHDIGAVEDGLTERRYGTFEARIENFAIENAEGRITDRLISGEPARVRMRVAFKQDLRDPVFGVMLRNRFGVEIYGTNTHLLKQKTGDFAAGSTAEVAFEFPALHIGRGTCQLSLAVHSAESHFYDYRVDCAAFEVLGAESSIGLVPLEMKLSIER
ncbi:ABC transporter ATP-binding protein [Candidatus Sumerlaeota bacterium]|nr:ABC transporter ATP-binding protein [Candidatus Sumerlaeota bacterium]